MSKYSLKKKEPVISEENAHAQMMMFLERYKIDIDSLGDDDKETIEKNTDQVVKYIMDGNLEIFEDEKTGDIKVKQTIENPSKNSTISELVFGEVQGKHKAQMKQGANEHDRMNQLMGAVCETRSGSTAVELLRSGDRRVLEAIAGYFL